MALLRPETRRRLPSGPRGREGGPDPARTGSCPAGLPRADVADAEAIVEGFLAGRPDAVGTIRSWADGIARHRAWGFDSPEDIVQDAMLALTRIFRSGTFVPGDLRAYVRRVVKNLCVSSYRKSVVRGTAVDADVERPDLATPDGAETIAVGAMARRVLDLLEEGCRRIVVLAYIEGLGRKEIADLLGISETAAKVRLFRCLERARQAVGGDRTADGGNR